MTRNGYFEILPVEMVREILNKISKLEDMASCRRVCKLFYETSMMYGRNLFLCLYKKELGCLIQSENMNCYILQGFYFNFFPAIRHSIRNQKKISHKYIDVEMSRGVFVDRDLFKDKIFLQRRLELWKRILIYLPVKKRFIKYTFKKWKKSISECLQISPDDIYLLSYALIFVDFYSDLFEMFAVGLRPSYTDRRTSAICLPKDSFHTEIEACMKEVVNVKTTDSQIVIKIEKFKSMIDKLL